jgi:hypothetical protein
MPRRLAAGGAWCSWCRRDAYSVVTSATAARADDSSTMVLSAANAAIRDWTARLFTARGRPRPVWWMSAAASSEKSVSERPARARWWR